MPKEAKLHEDCFIPGYYFNCKCKSTLFWPIKVDYFALAKEITLPTKSEAEGVETFVDDVLSQSQMPSKTFLHQSYALEYGLFGKGVKDLKDRLLGQSHESSNGLDQTGQEENRSSKVKSE